MWSRGPIAIQDVTFHSPSRRIPFTKSVDILPARQERYTECERDRGEQKGKGWGASDLSERGYAATVTNHNIVSTISEEIKLANAVNGHGPYGVVFKVNVSGHKP